MLLTVWTPPGADTRSDLSNIVELLRKLQNHLKDIWNTEGFRRACDTLSLLRKIKGAIKK